MHIRPFRRNIFSKDFFFIGKNHVFLRNLRENVSEVRSNLSTGSSKLHSKSLCVRRRFLSELFFLWLFLSFFAVFRLWEEHSAKLAQNLRKIGQNCTLLELQNFSRKICFLKKILTFTIFSSFDQKLCGRL